MVLAVDLGQSGARLKSGDSQFTSKRAKQAHESTLDVLNDLFAEAQENFGPKAETMQHSYQNFSNLRLKLLNP